MRINQYLAACGLGSRRSCEKLVLEGSIRINGQVITSLACQVEPTDRVMLGRRTLTPEHLRSILFHKPKAVLCSKTGDGRRRTVYDYLDPDLQNLRYAGRLDYDSDGLMVFSNDGSLINRLTHARFGTEKEYRVTLETDFDPAHIPRLLKGFLFEEGRAKALRAKHLRGPQVELVLNTGLNRQVRRMFARMGYEVKRLSRIRMGPWTLHGLPEGTWRALGAGDLAQLQTPRSFPGEEAERRKQGGQRAKVGKPRQGGASR